MFNWRYPRMGEHPDLPGFVARPTVHKLPDGYAYGVTRYADIVLRAAFPGHFGDLLDALTSLVIQRAELESGGGNRSSIATNFDRSLGERGWGKRTIAIEKLIDDVSVMARSWPRDRHVQRSGRRRGLPRGRLRDGVEQQGPLLRPRPQQLRSAAPRGRRSPSG